MHSLSGVETLPCNWSSPFPGQLRNHIKGTIPTVTVGSVDDCTDQCISQTTFICAAVNYKRSDGTCELLAENTRTATLQISFNFAWKYHLRPPCAGNLIILIFLRQLLIFKLFVRFIC